MPVAADSVACVTMRTQSISAGALRTKVGGE